MDGYNQYTWNPCYNQNVMVYPPQHENVGYDSWRNFDYHYQMTQVPPYYQDRRNEEWSHTSPRNVVQPQQNFQPHQVYDSSVSSSSNEGLSILELLRRRIQREGSTGLPKDIEAMIMKEIQESDMRKAQQQRPIGSAMSELHIIGENLKKEMENLENLKREEESDEDEEQEEGEGDPSEEEDEEVELNDEELEFIEALDEFLEEFKGIDSVELKDQETDENSHLSFFSRIYYNCLFDDEINRIFPFIVLDDDRSPLEAKEEDKHCFIEDEWLNEEENDDDNLIVKRDQEECPLMDTSTKEQESQEASKDDLKIEMSISQPLNSSICTFFDNDASIDFILPLDSFDNKKEVEKSLGILEQKGGEWKEMLRSYVEEKLCIKGMADRSTSHGRLIDEEAQRLRYTGKEDRYPWPFR
ncbi:hypothetical protein ACS0TY_032006 [Phlomoides rotata]